ncbi:hypothetical protein ES708_10589 [subsurface metagenome]
MKGKTKKAEKITLKQIDKIGLDTPADQLQTLIAMRKYFAQEKRSLERTNTIAIIFGIIALTIALSILTISVLMLDIL